MSNTHTGYLILRSNKLDQTIYKNYSSALKAAEGHMVTTVSEAIKRKFSGYDKIGTFTVDGGMDAKDDSE
jgi:hypothetical protein